jgi:NAD(P)H-flavin reductase
MTNRSPVPDVSASSFCVTPRLLRDTAVKRSLKKMPLGTEVRIGPATGSFTLHTNPAKPAVFVAGGIGITPFLSIVRQADHDRLPHKLHLFYSKRTTSVPRTLPDIEEVHRCKMLIPSRSLSPEAIFGQR